MVTANAKIEIVILSNIVIDGKTTNIPLRNISTCDQYQHFTLYSNSTNLHCFFLLVTAQVIIGNASILRVRIIDSFGLYDFYDVFLSELQCINLTMIQPS